MRVAATALALVAIVLALACSGPAGAEVIHREKSRYTNLVVKESRGERCLVFSVRRDNHNQSCMDLDNPDRLVFAYARMMLATLLLQPEPERILMVGLGGGSIPRVLHDLLPEARIDIVEIDPAVVRVAKEYFRFRAEPPVRVHIKDARVYVRHALAEGREWDLVLLDAFTGEYIPEHLMTREFLEEVRAVVPHSGVIAANTFTSSRLYDHESATYEAVFDTVAELQLPGTLNRIVLALQRPLPARAVLERRAAALSGSLLRFGVDIEDYPRRVEDDFDYDHSARVLTDQYAPVNLLQRQERQRQ